MTSSRRIRRFGALAALAALLAAVVLPATALRHSPDLEDIVLGSPSIAAHHATIQFESVRPPVTDDHCVACHLLRAVSGARARTASVAVPPPVSEWRRTMAVAPLLPGRHRGLPSRAPPAPSV